jgi:hypothetical protein
MLIDAGLARVRQTCRRGRPETGKKDVAETKVVDARKIAIEYLTAQFFRAAKAPPSTSRLSPAEGELVVILSTDDVRIAPWGGGEGGAAGERGRAASGLCRSPPKARRGGRILRRQMQR